MTNVTKADLIGAAAARTGISRPCVKTVLDALLEEIDACTSAGSKVAIQGWGQFEMKERAARTGRNPRTGEQIEIPASSRLTFKASKSKT